MGGGRFVGASLLCDITKKDVNRCFIGDTCKIFFFDVVLISDSFFSSVYIIITEREREKERR